MLKRKIFAIAGWISFAAIPFAQAEPHRSSEIPDIAPAEEKSKATGATLQSVCLLVESAARAHDLPVEFFVRVIWQESRFHPNAVGPVTRSGKRALGIAQFMPGTAAERNLLDPFNPVEALPKSAEFLSELRKEFGNLGLAAAAYNAGPRRVHDWLAGAGPMPLETRAYVHAVTGTPVDDWAKGGDARDLKTKTNCETLVAMLKRAPSPFFSALERRIVTGAMRPWGVILGGANSKARVLARYSSLQQRHAAVLAGRDPIIIERRRGPLPRYSVRVGADTRQAANELCSRIERSGGTCVVLRNPGA